MVEKKGSMLSPSILHPPNQPFSQKVGLSPLNLKKRNSLLQFSNYDLSSITKYRTAIEVCRVPPEKRTLEEIQSLVKNTVNMPYFQEINRKSVNKSEKIHERICVVMRYEFKRKGEIVFNADEKSNKFFIILSGSVNILIPKTTAIVLKEKLESPKVKKSILRIKPEGKGSEENSMTEDDMISSHPSVKTRFDQVLGRYHVLLGGLGLHDIKPSDIENLFDEGVLKFTYYTTLKEGQTFGELGLLTGKLRSATVICKEDCHFGVMMETDYKTIVSVIERKKIYDKFEFFKQYLIKDVAYEVLRKLSYSFEKNKFGRMQYVFREGETCKNVYLIKKGEIQILKMFPDHLKDQFRTVNKKLPLNPFIPKRKKILLSLLAGEFFGEDELLDSKFSEKEEKYHRKYSAVVVSLKASIYVCPLNFFKKFLLERPKFYNRFLEKYRIKNQIRQKQIENCLNHERFIIPASELESYSTNNNNNNNQDLNISCSYKKSVEDFKARLKFNEPPPQTLKTSSSASNILDLLSPSDEPNKILMSPIGFAKNEDKKYENSIYSKIRFINRKHSEVSLHNKVSPERGNLGVVFDDGGKTEALVRRKYDRKKNKSEIDLTQKYIRGGTDFDINFKALSQRNNSKHYDKVDLALLKNNEYFDEEGIDSNEKKEVLIKIRTMQNKKTFVFPKIIGGQNGVS